MGIGKMVNAGEMKWSELNWIWSGGLVVVKLRKRFERIRWGPQSPLSSVSNWDLGPSLSSSHSLSPPWPLPLTSLQILMGDEVMGEKKTKCNVDHELEILLGQVDPLWLSLFIAYWHNFAHLSSLITLMDLWYRIQMVGECGNNRFFIIRNFLLCNYQYLIILIYRNFWIL